jgi:TATA-binding protein-associated factor
VAYFDLPLKHYLKSISAFHQTMATIIIQEWGYEYENKHPGEGLVAVSTFANELRQISIDGLSVDPPACYHEAYSSLVTISTIAHGHIQGYLRDSRFASAGLTDPQLPTPGLFDISHAKNAVEWLDGLHSILNGATGTKIKNKRKEATKIDDAKKALRGYIVDFEETQEKQILQVQAAFAGATIALKGVPPKLTPLVRGVMNSIKVGCSIPESIFTKSLTIIDSRGRRTQIYDSGLPQR